MPFNVYSQLPTKPSPLSSIEAERYITSGLALGSNPSSDTYALCHMFCDSEP